MSANKTSIDNNIEDRKLQIKLAQLNARLQVYLGSFFGFFAGSIALIIFGYQFGFQNFPQFSAYQALISLSAFSVAGIAMVGSIIFIMRLRNLSKEFRNLK